jgi:hypothetical protein
MFKGLKNDNRPKTYPESSPELKSMVIFLTAGAARSGLREGLNWHGQQRFEA